MNKKIKPINEVTVKDTAIDPRGEELRITQVINKEAPYIKDLTNRLGWGYCEREEAFEYGMIKCDFGGEEAWFVYRDDDQIRTDIAVVYQEDEDLFPTTRTLELTHEEIEMIQGALQSKYDQGLEVVAMMRKMKLPEDPIKEVLESANTYFDLNDAIQDGAKDI